MGKKTFSYKEAIAEIERVVSQLESNQLDVDEMVTEVKRVNELLEQCRNKLHNTEEEVKKILGQ
ncbi:MAG: exodeoxyribonuclease VII small subunit [Bacteroidales bacterium]